MAASARAYLPSAQAHELKAKAERLRFELLLSQLELSYTMARFAADPNNSESLRRSCYKTARLGYGRVLKLLGSDNSHPQSIENHMRQLRSALMRISRAEEGTVASNPRTPPHAVVETAINTEDLTPRETQVLQCIAEGLTTKEVAGTLGITFKTAACHRSRIMEKLGAHNCVMLVRFAIRSGLIQP